MVSRRFWMGGSSVMVIWAVLTVMGVVTGDRNHGAYAQTPAAADKKDKLPPGIECYQKYCQQCHGEDGRGTAMKQAMPTIPDFTIAAWQKERTNPQLMISITDGKGALMPAFSDKVSNEQARDLVSFIRAFDPARASPQK